MNRGSAARGAGGGRAPTRPGGRGLVRKAVRGGRGRGGVATPLAARAAELRVRGGRARVAVDLRPSGRGPGRVGGWPRAPPPSHPTASRRCHDGETAFSPSRKGRLAVTGTETRRHGNGDSGYRGLA